MNHRISIPKRLLALVMAAVLIASNFSGLTSLVSAAEEHSVTTSVGHIVADNYALTDAEKALLESGLLTGGTITYTAPTDSGLIKVNNDEKTIEVATYKDDQGNKWIPTNVAIYVRETKVEEVALTDGKGTYTYAENAFSVKVSYTLALEIEESLQQTLLSAPAALKNGLENMKTAYNASDANLGTVVQAIDILNQLADGISLGWASAKFETQAAIDAARNLRNQILHYDELQLQTWNRFYAESNNKTEFLLRHGHEHQHAIVSTYNDLRAIMNDGLMNNSLLDSYLKSEQPSDYTAWMALKSILSNTVNGLEPAANGDWSALDGGLCKEELTDAEIAALDVLVNNLDTITAVDAIVNPLTVATTTVTLNMSMFDVTVNVVLQVVGKNNEIATLDSKQVILTLPENATATEIKAAVAANGIEDSALKAWAGIYAEGGFQVATSTLPENLTADATYTITYSPKSFNVSFGYAEAQTLPYGYKLELPEHENPTQAYDYTINGVKYAQGATYVVVGDTTITRTVGKAYTSGQLLYIISTNYGNDKLDAILNSGALFGDETVNVRYPDATDDSLLTLENGVLTATPKYDSSYNGLSWVPYSYGINGTENLFSGNTASFDSKVSKVIYRLTLDNYDAATVKAWLDLAVTLSQEAEGQISALDRLSAYIDTMSQLDKTKLGALNGVIDVTDLHTDPAKNAELKAYFKGLVSSIIAECLDTDGVLRICKMLKEYQAEGLIYYYQNSVAFQKELATVSGYLNGMLADSEKVAALTTLVTAAGYPDYAEKIQSVGTALETLQAELTAPNAAIDVNSENLDDLVDALLLSGDASYDKYGVLHLYSDALVATDSSLKKIQLFVNGTLVKTVTAQRGYVITEGEVALIEQLLAEYVNEQYGDNVKYYNVESDIDLDSLINTELNDNINVKFTYTAKKYTVKIDGSADQIITIEDLKVKLPKSAVSNIVYTYVIDGAEYTTSTYAFTAEQLDRLFTNGSYTITRVAVDMGASKLQQIVNDLNNKLGAGSVVLVTNSSGEIVGMKVNVAPSQLMDVIMGLTSYSYIGMNNEGLMYMMQDANGNYMTEISIQTVINALLSDNTFSSETLIALGEKGSGKLLNTTLQLGNDADDLIYNLDLVISLDSVPSQMGTVASALKDLRSYLKFSSNNGVMEFKLNLPDQVYGAYLVALITTGNVDKADASAIDQQIAFQFLCDYLDAVINSGTDMTTLENTLAMLGKDVSLEKYNKYYEAFVDALSYKADETGLSIGFEIPGASTISRLMSLIGIGGDQLDTYLGMVKENKEGAVIKFAAHATMSEGREYCALVLDANASGITNKFACIRAGDVVALNAKLSALSGYSVVILLSDVEGNLNVAGTTILDLNGKNVSGTIKSTGNLFIIDSSMDTYNAGSAYGVSGNVTVIAGNYETDVSKYLRDGYYMDGKTVRNALYYISSDKDGNTSFVVNTDVYKDENVDGYLPDIRFVAIDMMVDLVLNYATTAGLSVEGNTVYDVCFEDLLDMLKSRSGERVIDSLLACVNAAGLSDTINLFIADLLDFAAIYEGLCGDGTVASYDIAVAPWMVALERVEDGNYLTLSIRSNKELTKIFNISLKLEGNTANYVKDLAYELAGIVDEDTYVKIEIDQPNYDNKEFDFSASGNMLISLDMSKNDDYAKILSVILAYGNPNKAAEIALLINDGNIASLKPIIDNTTVAELFTALKVMSRNVSFADMAAAIGVTVDVTSAAKVEHAYHLILVAAGKVLEELDITGMNSKFGSLYNEETGYYVLDKFNTFREGELNYRGFSALYDLEIGELIFRVKLFGGHSHVFGEWIVQTPATCSKPGLKVRVCSCGETEYMEIPALGHRYKAVVTKPTCTDKGYTTYTCTVCGHSYVGRYRSALGHSYEAVVTAPTCTEQGYTTYTCTVCGDSYVADYVEALGHKFGEWYEETAATCTEDGVSKRDCEHCGHSESKVVPALGHDYVDGYCTRCGEKDPNMPKKSNIVGIIIAVVAALAAAAGATFVILYFKRKKGVNAVKTEKKE